VRAHPLVAEWYERAAAEPPEWQVPEYETPPAV
jgi:glutathione S-transferase